MLYQLPNGRVVEISTEQYLEMTDEELEYLLAHNHGEVLEDPWFGSVLHHADREHHQSPNEDLIELTDIPEEEKLSDTDFLEAE